MFGKDSGNTETLTKRGGHAYVEPSRFQTATAILECWLQQDDERLRFLLCHGFTAL